MSYYNYMYLPTKQTLEDAKLESDVIVLNDKEFGFSALEKEIGDEFVKFNQETEQKEIIFKNVEGCSDYIRPSELDWTWLNKNTTYGDADCFIYVHDMHNRIDWSKVKDIEKTESALLSYQNKVNKHGKKLIILPS